MNIGAIQAVVAIIGDHDSLTGLTEFFAEQERYYRDRAIEMSQRSPKTRDEQVAFDLEARRMAAMAHAYETAPHELENFARNMLPKLQEALTA